MNNRENQSESKYLPALDRARCRRNLISQDVFSCWLKFDNVASQIPTHCMTQHRYSLKLQLKLRNNIDVTLRTLLYKTVSISLCSFNRTRSMIGFKSCEFARTHDPRMTSHARWIPLKLFRQVRVKSPRFAFTVEMIFIPIERDTRACLRACWKTGITKAGEKIHFDSHKAHSWKLCFISILCQYTSYNVYPCEL